MSIPEHVKRLNEPKISDPLTDHEANEALVTSSKHALNGVQILAATKLNAFQLGAQLEGLSVKFDCLKFAAICL